MDLGAIIGWIFEHWQPILGGIGVTATFVTSGVSGVQAQKARHSEVKAKASAKELEGQSETLESLKAQVQQLRAENASLRGLFDQQKVIIDSIKLTLDETQQERDHLIVQLTQIKVKSHEDEQEINKLRGRIQELERRLDEALQQNSMLSNELAKARRAGYGKGKKAEENTSQNAD